MNPCIINENHNKFSVGYTIYFKYEPIENGGLCNKNGEFLVNQQSRSVEIKFYTCKEEGCETTHTIVNFSKWTDRGKRFFPGHLRFKTFEEAEEKYLSNTHFFEEI